MSFQQTINYEQLSCGNYIHNAFCPFIYSLCLNWPQKSSVDFLLNIFFCVSQKKERKKDRKPYRFGTTWVSNNRIFRHYLLKCENTSCISEINTKSADTHRRAWRVNSVCKRSETLNVSKRFNVLGRKFIIRVYSFVHWGGLWRELNATCSVWISQPYADIVIILTFNSTCVTSLIYWPSLIMAECTRRLSSHTSVSVCVSVCVCVCFIYRKESDSCHF